MNSKEIFWNKEKNEWLKKERGISFDDVLASIKEEKFLARIQNPNQIKYPGQWMFIVAHNGYAYLIPYVETETCMFLKTMIPNRKATKKYLT